MFSYIWDSNKRKMLSISPSTTFWYSSTEERHQSSTSHLLKWSFLFLISFTLPLFCLLLKKDVNCSLMEIDYLTLTAWWMNTSCGGWTRLWDLKKKYSKKLKRIYNYWRYSYVLDIIKKNKGSNKNWKLLKFFLVLIGPF